MNLTKKHIDTLRMITSLKVVLMIIGSLFFSCSEEAEPEKEVELTAVDTYTSIDESTGTIYITNLPGSTGSTYETGHIPVFFNLENHDIINSYAEDSSLMELSDEQKASTTWDVAFTSIYNSYITINNDTIEDSPGYGGAGVGAIIVLDELFDELDEAPSDEDFAIFMETQTATGWEDYPPGQKGWYFYSLDSHIMSAISGVTIVLKTANGNYAKLEMETLYLDNPENPTVYTPTPYFTFRYFLQEDGSKNLSTR